MERTAKKEPMASPSRSRPKLVAASPAPEAEPRRRTQVNHSDLAYERIEELLVRCELQPGRFLATSDLQLLVGYGRTPVHQAVSRLAADTLVLVTPRHGIQIAPIDLTREKVLLDLRRDVERFVIRLATQRSGASQRNQMLHIKRQLVEHGAAMTVDQFNLVDRRIDQLLLAAANEPFVESTLRPLHTIFRRLGWLYHSVSRAAAIRSVAHRLSTYDATCACSHHVAMGRRVSAVYGRIGSGDSASTPRKYKTLVQRESEKL
jgi:DNA-binding GntR family transcriptional regulator